MSSTNLDDPRDMLRARYLSEISELDKRKAAIQAKLNTLEEVLKDLREFENQNTFEFVTSTSQETVPASLTDAVIWTLDKNGLDHEMTTAEIKDVMLNAGFKPGGKHFSVALFKTLTRLAQSNRILGEKKGATWKFKSTKSLLA